MSNMKKILMTVSVATLAVGLSGCGRDNYQGTYTGFEVPTAANTTTGTTQNGGFNNGAYFNQQPSQVSLTLSDNGNVVTGTYTATSFGMQQMQFNTYGGQGTQFSASSENSGSLSNVSLLRYVNNQTCFYQGSLASSDHGRQITGSLSSAMSGNSGAWGAMCPTITLNLTRGN